MGYLYFLLQSSVFPLELNEFGVSWVAIDWEGIIGSLLHLSLPSRERFATDAEVPCDFSEATSFFTEPNGFPFELFRVEFSICPLLYLSCLGRASTCQARFLLT